MAWKEHFWSLLIDGEFEEANKIRQNNLPRELYRYRPVASLKDLEYRKSELLGNIYFSDLRGVNDPFDSRFMGSDAEELADAMNCVFDRVNLETLRLTCFSEKKNNMPMWAHYSGNHTGICFEYLTERVTIKSGLDFWPVVYVDQLLDRSEDSNKHLHSDPTKLIALMKLKDWSYEREWRLRYWHNEGRLNKESYNVYEEGRTRKVGKPTAVYFGVNASKDVVQYLADIALKNEIKVYHMRATPHGLEADEITS